MLVKDVSIVNSSLMCLTGLKCLACFFFFKGKKVFLVKLVTQDMTIHHVLLSAYSLPGTVLSPYHPAVQDRVPASMELIACWDRQ